MSYIKKPNIFRSNAPKNELGMTYADYEGAMSTLCAGCGHDSITGAIIQSVFDLNIPPHRMIKMSGIGCSSKTPAYFANQSHGFNSVHGRMPSGCNRGQCCKQRAILYRCIRRWRYLVNRNGSVFSCN